MITFKSIIILFVFCTIPSAWTEEEVEGTKLFSDFMSKYNKSYTEEEFRTRLRIFRANLKKIKYLQETEQGTATYGVNQFADLSESEFKKFYLGFRVPEKVKNVTVAKIPNIELPPEFDWRDHNAVTEVKNQGLCGSCWAFSVTGNIEGINAVKKGELVSLSEQELIDCDKVDSGCGGGYMWDAFESIISIGGLEPENKYPYKARNGECHFQSSDVKVSINGALNISSDETDMAKWLVANGPISIAINANAMQFYFGGVSHPLKFLCDKNTLDHGVLIVGYGVHRTKYTHKNLPYWIVKNSWGPHWGHKGYYLVYRGDGTCGLNKMPSSAIVN